MKITLAILLSALLAWGCSPKEPAADSTPPTALATNVSTNSAPRPTFRLTKSPQSAEQKEIQLQALTLFTNKDYAGVDTLAAKYRTSKDRYADGMWKLAHVYIGLELGNDASDAEWEARIDQVTEWLLAREASITPRVLKARLLVSYAWKIRGGGWSDSVKETQWKKFFERLQQATRTLKGANQLTERCPIFWSTWQRAALGLQMERKEYDALFAAATREFPDYWYYYTARATFLLPRWYGEEGDWERDLTQSADRVGGTTGDMLYAQVVWNTHHYGGGIDVFEGKKISWERVDQGFEQLLKAYPDSNAAKSERAFLAGLAGDKSKAQQYLADLNGEADAGIWDDLERINGFLDWLEQK